MKIALAIYSSLIYFSYAFITHDEGSLRAWLSMSGWRGWQFTQQITFKSSFRNVPQVSLTPWIMDFETASPYGFSLTISAITTTYFNLSMTLNCNGAYNIEFLGTAIDYVRFDTTQPQQMNFASMHSYLQQGNTNNFHQIQSISIPTCRRRKQLKQYFYFFKMFMTFNSVQIKNEIQIVIQLMSDVLLFSSDQPSSTSKVFESPDTKVSIYLNASFENISTSSAEQSLVNTSIPTG